MITTTLMDHATLAELISNFTTTALIQKTLCLPGITNPYESNTAFIQFIPFAEAMRKHGNVLHIQKKDFPGFPPHYYTPTTHPIPTIQADN